MNKLSIEDKKQEIKKLQEEIHAMQEDPSLRDGYNEKIRALIKLRRSLIRTGRKKVENSE